MKQSMCSPVMIALLWLSGCSAMNTARDGLRTVDHLMPHISTVPADKDEQVKIFVREKVLAAELIVLVSQGNLPA